MPLPTRQKACIPCAKSKRKCDKRLPECQRCLDRDVDCAYPQPRRRRRGKVVAGPHASDEFSAPHVVDINTLAEDFEIGDWGAIEDVGPDVSLPNLMDISRSTLAAPVASLSMPASETHHTETINSCPWFLREETWVLEQNNEDPGCVTSVELNPFIDAVNNMLQSWAKTGHNDFIHRRLYEEGMPKCLQHAFTTLAAYMGRTPATQETILQIADENAFDLVRGGASITADAQGIRNHLARTHALLVYLFIRLFDGSVRLRASAEAQLPTLRHWLSQLLKAAKQYRGDDRLQTSLPWLPNHFDMEYNSKKELWKLWILTESLRRTHLVAGTVANMYEIMVKGSVECSGAVMCTARRGLWDVDSAMKWYELSCLKSPLLVPALQPGLYVAQYAAGEFDDFVQLIWSFVIGADKVQCWVDRSKVGFLEAAAVL